ncbi:maltose ABC transporter permease MalF [Roseateles sp. BYS87W]|uniref:Maltose/maltodextrin transport system permease protein n=1 Tax=Pelomonas baiyunensis TaxID=3299026 RepID=A0ABW7GZD8_9BURK
MTATGRRLRAALTAAAALLGLFGLQALYAQGQPLLAAALLGAGALVLWAYTAGRSAALRFLLPGLLAAGVFVVLPLVFTVGMGFTNYSARNLLPLDEARALLLAEHRQAEGSERAFHLHDTAAGLWLELEREGAAPVPLDDAATPRVLPLQPLPSPLPWPAAPPNADRADAPDAPNLRLHVRHLARLRTLTLRLPQGPAYRLATLREFAVQTPLFTADADGSLREATTGRVFRPDASTGFFTSASGDRLQPGFRVSVGWQHYTRLFTDARLSAPFAAVFGWTVLFAAGSVALTAALGLVLAALLNWQSLEGRSVYRLVLFLPYAVPAFISILVFKGLFNQNLGEINLVLHGLFGVKPAWFSDPTYARLMLLLVNLWLGFPYMTVLCSGLIQSIPADLYEASAEAGAGPWVNFSQITLPLILKPLTPLLIASFAFNFNNFVLISLLTGGRPDQLDAALPAGTTDLLVTYTWRIAFQDSGQQFGLAAAVSTLIFVLVAGITLVQMRLTRQQAQEGRR